MARVLIDYVEPYPSGNKVSNLPQPDVYVPYVRDVSKAGAGRTEDFLMHKKMVGQSVEVELGWKKVSITDCSNILMAFRHEYVTVKYLDPTYGSLQTKVFYVTDRNAPAMTLEGYWDEVSFTIIERGISNPTSV